jgi:hypothetical protein
MRGSTTTGQRGTPQKWERVRAQDTNKALLPAAVASCTVHKRLLSLVAIVVDGELEGLVARGGERLEEYEDRRVVCSLYCTTEGFF